MKLVTWFLDIFNNFSNFAYWLRIILFLNDWVRDRLSFHRHWVGKVDYYKDKNSNTLVVLSNKQISVIENVSIKK
jgi:hypothetical protein